MSDIVIKSARTSREMRKFVRFNWELYKDCPYAVPDFLEDTLNTFNPKVNPALTFCDTEFFMAFRDGKMVGRVVGIINHKANKTWNQKNVRFGWIDFIDDVAVSKALLDTVEQLLWRHLTYPLTDLSSTATVLKTVTVEQSL